MAKNTNLFISLVKKLSLVYFIDTIVIGRGIIGQEKLEHPYPGKGT